MSRTYDRIDSRLSEWLLGQPVFFVATAPLAADGHVNCSPKGNRQELVVLDDRTVAYLDQTGSGVETIAHLRENGRVVLMFCSFDGPPRIVRLHGMGRALTRGEGGFEEVAGRFPGGGGIGVRSIIVVTAERISDSCGFGVPVMPFDHHRTALQEWADRKGRTGVTSYWSEKNGASLDGLPGVTTG